MTKPLKTHSSSSKFCRHFPQRALFHGDEGRQNGPDSLFWVKQACFNASFPMRRKDLTCLLSFLQKMQNRAAIPLKYEHLHTLERIHTHKRIQA